MRKVLIIILLNMVLGLSAVEVFVVNSSSQTLTKLNTETGNVDNEFASLGLYTNRIALTEDLGYIVNSGDNTLQKVDLNNGQTLATILIAAGCNPYDLILDGQYAYVSGLLTNKVYMVNLETEAVVNEVTVGASPTGMAIADGKLYVANSGSYPDYTDSSVSVIDLSTFSVINTITVDPNAQYIQLIDGLLHVACSSAWGVNAGTVKIIDPASDTVNETIAIGGYLGNIWASSNNKVYIADGNNAGLYAYNKENYSPIYTFTDSFSTPGSLVGGTDNALFIVDSMWGSNGVLKVFNLQEEFQQEYTLGMSPTDIKVRHSSTSSQDVTNPQLKISVYPNPFTSQITIDADVKSGDELDFSCYDLRGRKMFSRKVTKSSINMENVPSGVYFYRINRDGRQISAGKILKVK
jgi:YVTN family beta-propeller protein